MPTALMMIVSVVMTLTLAAPLPPIAINATFGSNMVLQREPAKAAIYGTVVPLNGLAQPATVTVLVTVDGENSYTLRTQATGYNYSQWLVYLAPHAYGGNVTIAATCQDGCGNASYSAIMTNTTFGEVFYCSGQSNMWLPLLHTFTRNDTVKGIHNGTYSHIHAKIPIEARYLRLDAPWMTASQAIADGNWTVPSFSLFQFPSTCWYFAQALSDEWRRDGLPTIPIGLISTAVGGTQIESWVTNATLDMCHNVSRYPTTQGLYDEWVVPYQRMTIAGFVWYQGENDMGEDKGNILYNEGYACVMPKLVELWRRQFSLEAGTTSPQAPFGLVTLASGTDEGHPNIAAMRWAQTSNFGVLPSPTMPQTFLAQAFDLGDPYTSICASWQCCLDNYNATQCAHQTNHNPSICHAECETRLNTSVFMGAIHPRDKLPVGQRLAKGAMAIMYNQSKPYTGPTLSGCSIDADKQLLTITFNTSLLRGDTVVVKPYNLTVTNSNLRVLVNASFFCVHSMLRCRLLPNGTRPTDCPPHLSEWYCPHDYRQTRQGMLRVPSDSLSPLVAFAQSLGDRPPPDPFDSADNWLNLNVTVAGDNAIVVDLTPLNGTVPVGVRYAWNTDTDCCMLIRNSTQACIPGTCPLFASSSNLPANPFMARIIDGKCSCVLPQVCDD